MVEAFTYATYNGCKYFKDIPETSCDETMKAIGPSGGEYSYYTTWSYYIYYIILFIVFIVSIFFRSSQISEYLIPVAVAVIINSLTVGLVSQLLMRYNFIVKNPENVEAEAMSMNIYRQVQSINIIYHITPLYSSIILLSRVMKLNNEMSFNRLFKISLLLIVAFMLTWACVPIKNSDGNNVILLEKIDLVYANPSIEILLTFLLSILVISVSVCGIVTIR